jgi:hypothetical protein
VPVNGEAAIRIYAPGRYRVWKITGAYGGSFRMRIGKVRFRRFYLYESFSRLPPDLLDPPSPKIPSPHSRGAGWGEQNRNKKPLRGESNRAVMRKETSIFLKYFTESFARTSGNFLRCPSHGGTFSGYTPPQAVV